MSSQNCKRKANWSSVERTTLVEAVVDNYSSLTEKFSESQTAEKRDIAWKDAMEKVNSVGGSNRSLDEVMKKWADLKSQTKKKEIRRRREMKKTGGGGDEVILANWEEKIVSIFPDAQIDGVAGGNDVFETNIQKDANENETVVETELDNGETIMHPGNVSIQFEREKVPEVCSLKGQKRNLSEKAQYDFFLESIETARVKRRLMEQQIKTSKAQELYYLEAVKKMKYDEKGNEQ